MGIYSRSIPVQPIPVQFWVREDFDESVDSGVEGVLLVQGLEDLLHKRLQQLGLQTKVGPTGHALQGLLMHLPHQAGVQQALQEQHHCNTQSDWVTILAWRGEER